MQSYCTVFLDLDDTLYPQDSGVWNAIGERIVGFLVRHLSVSEIEAIELRQKYTLEYGTTLKGLIEHHAVEPRAYMDYVHDLPVGSMLSPNPKLASMLASLPQDIFIFTNADQAHAGRVIKALGISSEIDGVIGYFDMAPYNKPEPEAYKTAWKLAGGVDPGESVLVDDQRVNLEVAAQLGMMTVLVGDGPASELPHHQIARVTDLLDCLPDLLYPPTARIIDA